MTKVSAHTLYVRSDIPARMRPREAAKYLRYLRALSTNGVQWEGANLCAAWIESCHLPQNRSRSRSSSAEDDSHSSDRLTSTTNSALTGSQIRAPPRLRIGSGADRRSLDMIILSMRFPKGKRLPLFPHVNVACGGWLRGTQLDVALSARQSGGASHTHLPQAGGVS